MTMFNIFKKRKESQSEAPPLPVPECIHTWKDFPWYITEKWEENEMYQKYHNEMFNKGTLTLILYEPYVCAHCHKRKDIKLSHCVHENVPYELKDTVIKQFTEKYKDYIQPVAVVEDMINDFIYVDREKLDILNKLRQKKEGPTL